MSCNISQTARRTLIKQVNSPIDATYNKVVSHSIVVPCIDKPSKLWEIKIKISLYIESGAIKYGRCDVTGDSFTIAMTKEALDLSIGSLLTEGASWLTIDYLLIKLDLEACDVITHRAQFVIDTFSKIYS